MELFSIRIQRTFQLVSTLKGNRDFYMLPAPNAYKKQGYLLFARYQRRCAKET